MKFSLSLVTLCIGLVAAAPLAPESDALGNKPQPGQPGQPGEPDPDRIVFPDDPILKPKPTSSPVPDDAC
ncbi:hypothetical protein MGU_01596 [Metarhizium guizhouense ARSEF 977]|uniref:Uncharacterized protein n=1 Tax=Metarhizium guizhouense (strain ARSEF 977) TaxID=1276136 RepID=A0A0B4HNN2_METGA|nr:hypothetical protein MGU_01596 [Metarhizium guizhouense ARSEF 977]